MSPFIPKKVAAFPASTTWTHFQQNTPSSKTLDPHVDGAWNPIGNPRDTQGSQQSIFTAISATYCRWFRNPAHQLRLGSLPTIISKLLAPCQVVVWDFFHQQVWRETTKKHKKKWYLSGSSHRAPSALRKKSNESRSHGVTCCYKRQLLSICSNTKSSNFPTDLTEKKSPRQWSGWPPTVLREI